MKKLRRMLVAFMSVMMIGCFLSSDLSCGVLQPVKVEAAKKQSNNSVKLNKTKITLKPGETFKLKVSGKTDFIYWRTSGNSACVNQKGKVTALYEGSATIIAKVSLLSGGKKTLKCKVIVEDYPEEYVLASEAIYEAAHEANVGSLQFNYENQVLHIDKIAYQGNVLNEYNHVISKVMIRYYVESAEYAGNRYIQIIKTNNPEDYNYDVINDGEYYYYDYYLYEKEFQQDSTLNETGDKLIKIESEDAKKIFEELSENGSIVDNKKTKEIFQIIPTVPSKIRKNQKIIFD